MEGGNDNNSPPQGIIVMTEGKMYRLGFIHTNVPIPAGELLAQICSDPGICELVPDLIVSCMGLRDENGELLQHDNLVQIDSVVYLCQAKSSHTLRSKVSEKEETKNTETNTPREEKRTNYTFPEAYIGKNRFLYDVIDEMYDSIKFDHARFIIRISESRCIDKIIRVTRKGCRAKLALEMLCLFLDLNRDDWVFLDSSVKWILPEQEYVVVPTNPEFAKNEKGSRV